MAIELEASYLTELDEMRPGTTLRFNHIGCPAGEDTRRRLYVTRPPTGDHTLAYCHNCQQGDRWTVHDGYRVDFLGSTTGAVPKEVQIYQIPEIETDVDSWPAPMLRRFWSHGLNVETASNVGIGYDAHTHSIYLPIWGEVLFKDSDVDNVLDTITLGHKGYQLRGLKGNGPKYTTAMRDKTELMCTLLTRVSPKMPRTGVVVEDLLSGIRIIQAAAVADQAVQVLVNYGTAVDPQKLAQLDCSRIVVWLDNDNDHVIEQAKKMRQTLHLVHGVAVTVCHKKIDPKADSYNGIEEVLWTP